MFEVSLDAPDQKPAGGDTVSAIMEQELRQFEAK